jgi:regulatory protein YycH of two-component signal transduction system YycFG
MISRLKTVILILLVLGSLVQTYLLVYSSPKFEPINQTEYVTTELDGTQAQVTDLLFPEQIILHLGNKRHTVLPMNHLFYKMIYDDFLKKREFGGFRKVSSLASFVNWEEVRNNHQGFEVRFKEGIPLTLLKGILQIKEDSPVDNDVINRVWIYIKDSSKEEVKSYFFSDSTNTLYESVKADVDAKNVERYVGLGEYLGTLTPYHTLNGDYYLPDTPIAGSNMQVPYTQFTADQLKRNLFADPAMTRSVPVKDGSQIFYDGKRGLQLKADQHLFTYTDPIITPAESKNDIRENLGSAVQFINQHGGWNSSYLYSQLIEKPSGGPQNLVFRQYVNSYPVINAKQDSLGFIRIELQKGVVSSYERSLVNLNLRTPEMKETSLVGGKDLDALIAAYPDRAAIQDVFPAYQAVVVNDQTVELVLRWAVELRDGTHDFL